MRLIDADEFEKYVRKHCKDSLADLWCELIRRQPTCDVTKTQQWIPVTWHNTTEDDGIDMQKYLICFDCPMPEEDQEILVCGKNGNIWLDTCCSYDGYVLDSGNDWVDDISAWMPLPEPYREEGETG